MRNATNCEKSFSRQRMGRQTGFLFVAAAFTTTLFAPLAAGDTVPAIYVFGDSSVDVGNNNFLAANDVKVNFLPYGIDFPGGKPTGRFCNGYVGIDYFAQNLGYAMSPPAYLSITSDAQAIRGVNFASGGSGILDVTGQGVSIPLNQQIRYFQGVSLRLRSRVGDIAAQILLSKSIFYFSTGNNDLKFLLVGVQNQTQQNMFIAQLANQLKNQFKTLYDQGARKFLVFGVLPLGCVPSVRLVVPGSQCLEYLNNLLQEFNRVTRISLQELAKNLKGFSYSFVNAYDFVSLLLSEPLKYGFTETASACCGSGRLNAESGCTPTTNYCSDRSKYIFWDAVHPTQAFYKAVIRAAFEGGRYASPVTIEQLIWR